MEKRYQVFVSSTYDDLKKERMHLIQALLEMDCIPAGMELFPAADDNQWTLIKSVIDDCDYYVVIIGGRYGSIDPKTDVGYTEMEYDYAISTGKPVIGFIHQDPRSLPVKDCESTDDGRERLYAFSSKVKDKMVQFWTNADELAGKATRSLVKLIKQKPGVGWVRANHAVSAFEITSRDQRIENLEAQLAAQTPKFVHALSGSAMQLLHNLASKGTYELVVSKTLRGMTYVINGREASVDQLESKRLQTAVQELSKVGYIEARAGGMGVYGLTETGLEFAKKNFGM